jgi:hypothetical protein
VGNGKAHDEESARRGYQLPGRRVASAEKMVATANPFFRFAVGSSGWEMEKPTTRRALVVATRFAGGGS